MCDVLGEEVEDEFLDVVEHATAFGDGVQNGGEVVICENDGGGIFGDVRAGEAHGNADVGAFEGGRIIDAVAGLGA